MDSIHETGDEREDALEETKSERERTWVLEETPNTCRWPKVPGVRGCERDIYFDYRDSFQFFFIILHSSCSLTQFLCFIFRNPQVWSSSVSTKLSWFLKSLTGTSNPSQTFVQFCRQVTLIPMWIDLRHFTQGPAQRHLWFWKAFHRPHNSTTFLLIFDSWDKPKWTAFGSN